MPMQRMNQHTALRVLLLLGRAYTGTLAFACGRMAMTTMDSLLGLVFVPAFFSKFFITVCTVLTRSIIMQRYPGFYSRSGDSQTC